jgi:hypothetical protein
MVRKEIGAGMLATVPLRTRRRAAQPGRVRSACFGVRNVHKNGECFLRFAEMPFITTGKPLLFHGVLHELGAFLKEKAYQITPEYWWPPNNDWCVCSDYDLKFTVVGGSRELIANLLKNDVLECLEVQSHTRIDYLAPMP